MTPLPRCPDSLIPVTAEVLREGLIQAVPLPKADEAAPSSPPLSSVEVYLSTVTITGRQIADFGSLVTAATRKSPFVWTDPRDGIDMLVTFASMPSVLSTLKTVVRMDRFFPSSKMCSACQQVVDELPLKIRSWVCPRCGADHDRDLNAAKNILAAGQAAIPHGAEVTARRRSRRPASRRRSANRSERLATVY